MGKKGGTRRYFSKGYKLSVVKRNIDGESSGKLSKELGLDKSLICHWARAYRDIAHTKNDAVPTQKDRRCSLAIFGKGIWIWRSRKTEWAREIYAMRKKTVAL